MSIFGESLAAPLSSAGREAFCLLRALSPVLDGAATSRSDLLVAALVALLLLVLAWRMRG